MWQGWDWKPGSLTLGSVGLAKMCSSSRRAVETGPGMWDSSGRTLTPRLGGGCTSGVGVCGPMCPRAHCTVPQQGVSSCTWPNFKASGSEGERCSCSGVS